MNDESQAANSNDNNNENDNNNIKFETSMTRTNLCDYSDAQILVKKNISVPNTAGGAVNNTNKEIIFKKCAPITNLHNRNK